VITLIVPTRNRAYTLRLVAPSFYAQAGVDEIVIVDDAGTDNTPELAERLSQQYRNVRTVLVKNPSRRGASESRNIGVAHASNEFILFCDDDEHLEQGYAQTCLTKLLAYGAGAVSGRRVYMEPGDTQDDALARFGTGWRQTAPFQHLTCEIVNAARFTGDIQLPFTNAVVLTRKSLLERFPFDPYYARGNGYREESDFQMSLFVHGFPIYVTNDCHSIHLPMSEVRQGGQRMPAVRRIYWSIHNTDYFYRKHYDAYASKVSLRAPRPLALAAFAAFVSYREIVRAPLHAKAKWLRSRVAQLMAAPMEAVDASPRARPVRGVAAAGDQSASQAA
jgi:glycosyltransferase involved in cell wall biosynthesis